MGGGGGGAASRSKKLIAALNCLTAVVSLAILLPAAAWLACSTTRHGPRCLHWPLLLGLLLSLLGLSAALSRSTRLLWLYSSSLLLLLLLLLLLASTLFAFAVITYKGPPGHSIVSAEAFRKLHLGNHSSWLQRQIHKESVWSKIRACLADSRTCRHMAEKYTTLSAFDAATDISSIQSGCCKPPTACGFAFGSNATDWILISSTVIPSAAFLPVPNCALWSDDQSELCYSCSSCKAGVLERVRKDWHKLSIVSITSLAFMAVVYSVSCCAIRSVRREKRYGYVI